MYQDVAGIVGNSASQITFSGDSPSDLEGYTPTKGECYGKSPLSVAPVNATRVKLR